jgi:transposase
LATPLAISPSWVEDATDARVRALVKGFQFVGVDAAFGGAGETPRAYWLLSIPPRSSLWWSPARSPMCSASVNHLTYARRSKSLVGLYVNPPDHPVVLSVDEKSQIQALDRTSRVKGRAGTMTHDYKRHGVTILFAALNVLEGKVFGQCMKRHRHQEFIRFLNVIDARVPKKKAVHVIVDNYAAHKHPNVMQWIGEHPRFIFHYTPTIGLVAQCRRGLIRQPRKETAQTRCVPIPARTQRCHPPLPRRHQRKPKVLYLD